MNVDSILMQTSIQSLEILYLGMYYVCTSVADPGSGAFFTPRPGSGIQNVFFRILDPKPIFMRA
jgi:hypothetical protein